jgi:signal transduction histidine kinase
VSATSRRAPPSRPCAGGRGGKRPAAPPAAVAAERARIARELHDVIGHSISVMGVQAGAVRRRLGAGQEREREALEAVERVGRDAVAEMQRLLGFLRDDGGDSARGALPTLQRVGELVAQLRRAGLDVDLRLEGDVDDLPPGRALAAFRVVQEALTNVLKHAAGAHVRVTVRRSVCELEIEVIDDGGPSAGDPRASGGYGLVAMRERVAMYGGTLDARPRPEGGFAVSARLPTGAP